MKRITWINLILGLWLIIAPFVLGYAGLVHAAAVQDVIMGIIIAAFSWWILAAMSPLIGAGWFQILCGIWVLIGPFVLGYSGLAVAKANDVTVGIIVLIVAIIESIGMARTLPAHTTA